MHAWEYQTKFTELQDDINLTIREAITAISTVLEGSTKTTLEQFEEHVEDIHAMYVPTLELFNRLQPSSCRNSAQRILDDTTEFTGFDGSNCANAYDIRVRSDIAAANKALVRFDDLYSQVQTIVVKAFIGQNAFITPEEIKENITHMFGSMEDKWAAAKPDIEAIKLTLASTIASQNKELGNCHTKIETDAEWSFSRFDRMVQTCYDFDNSQSPLKGRLARNDDSYVTQMEEFEAEFSKLKPYEWQA